MLYILGLYDITKLLLDRKVQRLEKSNHKCHILRILLVYQANIEAQCKKGLTPLMLATIEENYKVMYVQIDRYSLFIF